jgi:hypothetical protein
MILAANKAIIARTNSGNYPRIQRDLGYNFRMDNLKPLAPKQVENNRAFRKLLIHILKKEFRISADIGFSQDDLNGFAVHTWAADKPGKGDSRQALKFLKEFFGWRIIVPQAGAKTDNSFRFWSHMKEKGLIDSFAEG